MSSQGQAKELGPGSYLGPYVLQSELGRGGMGVVYRAVDNQLRRVVALKVLIAGEDASDMAVARFQLEAEAVAKLGQHPNIVPVFDIGRQGRLQYFSMEFVDGRPLDQLIAGSEITPKRAAVLISGVCQGLAHAHEQGILHRDIKPANILIDRKGIPKITDFGLAKDLDEDSGLTQSGVTMGSPQYMSPEQANGETELIDQRSDVYSLGASLYQMLTGTPPFQGKTTIALIQKILMEEPEDPRARNPGIDVDLASICLKCIEKEPERRYSTAQEVLEDLNAYLDGRPVSAKPVTRRRRLMLWFRRNRAFALMTVIAILALLTALLTTIWFSFVKAEIEKRNARAYEIQTLARIQSQLKDHLEILEKRIEAEANSPSLPRDFEKETISETLMNGAGLSGSTDSELLKKALEDYRAEPFLSRIAYAQGKWFRAYRYDPNGRWGLQAQIEIAGSFNEKRQFTRSRDLLERILERWPTLRKTVQSEKAAKEIELRALDLLFVAQTELGAFAKLRTLLKRRRALRANYENPQSRKISQLLRAVGGNPHEIPLGKRIPGGAGYETFDRLALDSNILVLANRQGRPAFKIEDGELKKLPVSPLAIIDETHYINRVHTADLNGDGKVEILAAVTRGGKGGLIVLEKQGQSWKTSFEKIDSIAHAYELIVGDFNGDGRTEAFLIFKWQAGYHWYIGFNNGVYCQQVRLNPEAPYVCGGTAYDVNDDGRDELILGRPPAVNGKLEVYSLTSNHAGTTPTVTIVSERILGGARDFARDETGLIAATVSVPPSSGKKSGMVKNNGLSLLRWENNEFKLLNHLSFGYRYDGTISDMGAVHKGQLLGESTFAWHSKQYLIPKKELVPGVEPEAIYLGLKLQFLIGAQSKEAIQIGYPAQVFAMTLVDVDGDGNSELLVLTARGLGKSMLRIHGVPKHAPPNISERAVSSEKLSSSESLLQTVEDLLNFASPDSYEEAYALAKLLGEKYSNRTVGQKAQCLQIKAKLKRGRFYESEEEKEYVGKPYNRYENARSLAAYKYADLSKALDAASKHSENAKKSYRTALNDVIALSSRQSHKSTRDQLLGLGREAARRLMNWGQLKVFNEQLSGENYPRPMPYHHLSALSMFQSENSEILRGRFTDPQIPLRVDFPFRAKTITQFEKKAGKRNRGTQSKFLEFVLDVHSQRNYIGIPVKYNSGAFQFEMDLETDYGAWELQYYFGLVPRKSTMSSQFDPEWEILRNHFSRPGSICFKTSSINMPERTNVSLLLSGAEPRKPKMKNQRGKWTFKYLFSPETETISLEVYDRVLGRNVYHYKSRLKQRLTPGRYLLGVSMGYAHDSSLRYHRNYAPSTLARLGAVKLWGTGIQLDKNVAVDLQGIAQQAGAALLRGDEKQAISLYKKALDKNPRHFISRLHLAILMDSTELFQESIGMDPYAFALIVDDAFRGAHPDKVKKLGQLLQKSAKKYPGFCAPFLGDQLSAQRSTLGPSAAARYLRMRLKTKGYVTDLNWLRDRRLRHPGTELPEIFWAPTAESREPTLQQIQEVIKQRKKAGLLACWIHLSRRLILEPTNCDLLYWRAITTSYFGEWGRAANDLRRRAKLSPKDPKAWRDLADFLGSRFQLIEETLDALDQALKNRASPKILDAAHFQYLKDNPRFRKLRKDG